MKIICPSCLHKMNVKWSIDGIFIDYVIVHARCTKCKNQLGIMIKIKEKKVEIRSVEADYIS